MYFKTFNGICYVKIPLKEKGNEVEVIVSSAFLPKLHVTN
jgi:hypothetical protein